MWPSGGAPQVDVSLSFAGGYTSWLARHIVHRADAPVFFSSLQKNLTANSKPLTISSLEQ